MSRSKMSGGQFAFNFPHCPLEHLPGELKLGGSQGADGRTRWFTCTKCGARWERGWTAKEVAHMEALEFRIDPSEEIVDITNFRCANSVFLEKDIKEVRELIQSHLHWYTHTKPNGTVVRGTRATPRPELTQEPKDSDVMTIGKHRNLTYKTIHDDFPTYSMWVVTKSEEEQNLEPELVHLAWYLKERQYALAHRPKPSGYQNATDVREKDTAVMKKRVVSVEQEEGFQVVLSPVAQEIDKRYQELLANGKTPAEATQFMMNQVAATEMAAFMEWLRYKEK